MYYYNDLYWDEGLNFYLKYKKGYENSNKRLTSTQVRQYKTWKYNRKNNIKINHNF